MQWLTVQYWGLVGEFDYSNYRLSIAGGNVIMDAETCLLSGSAVDGLTLAGQLVRGVQEAVNDLHQFGGKAGLGSWCPWR